MRWNIVGLYVLVLSLAGAAARADDAADLFKSVYAKRIATAKASPDVKDDLALAAELLAEAKKNADAPELVVLMCDAAYDLGSKAAPGYPTAAQAMQLLGETARDRAGEAQEKVLALLQKQFNAARGEAKTQAGAELIAQWDKIAETRIANANLEAALAAYRQAGVVAGQVQSPASEDLRRKADALVNRIRALAAVDRLKQQLAADAKNAPLAVELVKLFVVELESPAQAAPYLPLLTDAALRRNAVLAGKDVASLTGGEATALAEWYQSLAAERAAAKLSLLARARTACRRALETEPEGLAKKKVELMLADIERRYTEAGGGPDKLAELRRFTGHEGYIRSVQFSADGRLAVTGSDDKTIRIWDVATGQELKKIEGHGGPANDVQLSADGKTAIATTTQSLLRTYDVDTGKPVATRPIGDDGFWRIDASNDGRVIVSGGLYRLRVTDGRTGKSLHDSETSSYSVAISPDGRRVAFGGWGKVVQVRELAPWKTIADLTGHTNHIYALAFSPDGRYLGSTSGRMVMVHDLTTQKAIKQFDAFDALIDDLALSKDARRALVWSRDGGTRIYDIAAGKELYHFERTNRRGDLSPDGKIALIPMGKEVAVWALP